MEPRQVLSVRVAPETVKALGVIADACDASLGGTIEYLVEWYCSCLSGAELIAAGDDPQGESQ